MEDDIDLEAPGIVSSHCEFCGRKYYIDPDGGRVMHELPMCPEFEAMDPMSFIVENRKIKETKLASRGNN